MDLFDVIGPVMVGPSSSHTAGAARIGKITRRLLGCRPVCAKIGLYGSFQKTYLGHGTDKALIGGLLGMNVDAIMASASGGTGIGETARETVNLSMQMQTFLKSVNLPGGFTDYVISGVKRITTIISASGVQILLFLAGLQSVTPSQLEAAHMEGANSWEIFWKITVPIVSPILLVSTLYTVIDSFTANSNPVIQAVQGKYAGLQFGMGSAMSWLYILVVFLIIGLVYGLLSKVVFYQDN